MKPLLLLCAFTILIGCNSNDSPQELLEDVPILGTWEIESRTMDGISDLLPECCIFLEFTIDDNPVDYMGTFRYYDSYSENLGSFTIYDELDSLVFQFDDRELYYAFSITDSNQSLNFNYVDDDHRIEETWRKVE